MDENLLDKTLKTMHTETIDETLLDELQAKVCFRVFFKFEICLIWTKKVFEILSSNKYYGQFKTTPQYLKVLSEIDFTDSLNDNNSG